MGGGYFGTMNGNVVERFFCRNYDEQEDDCKLTPHTDWTPSLTGGSDDRLVEDAIHAREGAADGAPAPASWLIASP
jgi:hypothetical protein